MVLFAAPPDHVTGRRNSSNAAVVNLKERGDKFGAIAASVDFDDFDDRGDGTRSGDAAVIHQIGSSLFMDECDKNDNSFTEDAKTSGGTRGSALMTSFDALEDIDLDLTASSQPSEEQLEQLHHCITSGSAINIVSTDGELASQLQAEEDELTRKQQEALIFRKTQQKATRTSSTPPRKLKKSWLDDLIGEPFPQEVRRNYARADRQKSSSSGLMAAIAAAEARANNSSALSDRTNTAPCNRGLGQSNSFVDEGLTQLSTSISKWWSSKVVPISSNSDDDKKSPTTTQSPARFIDNGSEGYYNGDYLTDDNNKVIQPLQRHGQGTMTYNSGHAFTGNFQNNLLHGWGIYLWSDGDRQRGTWKDGLRHGPCIFHHAESDAVEYGYYHHGKVVGEGVRLNAERTAAWKVVDGKRLEGKIDMEEAEKIVAERFSCFPIPVAVKRRIAVNEEEET